MKKFRLLIIIFVLLGLVTACKPEKTPVNPESITINSQQSELEVNGSLQLTALVLPAEAEQSVVWSSSDETIATVDNTGKVLGLSAGTVSITATSTKLSSISKSISLEVKTATVHPSSITINSPQKEVDVNSSLQLTALVWPAEAEQSVVWSSSDESIATVDNTGKVLGLSAGTVSITATSTKLSSISNSISLKIKALVVLPETVTINSTQNKLDVDSSLQLTAVVLPAQAEQSVVWKSSDESIATVDSTGKVLGISPGKVSITATSTKSTSISNKITLKIKPVSIPTDLEDFDVFIENIFLDMIADDPVNVNFFLRYPENFELGERKVEAIDVSLEAHQTVIAEAKALKESLEYYISVDLTEEQELTYDVTMDYLNKTIAYEN
ncbi:MAG TPA: Ig-like domain-containing protein, partial [Bacilli bacterium]|nr:Ig-like domain-containing protein [Bacilli bacterium]